MLSLFKVLKDFDLHKKPATHQFLHKLSGQYECPLCPEKETLSMFSCKKRMFPLTQQLTQKFSTATIIRSAKSCPKIPMHTQYMMHDIVLWGAVQPW